jgi:hypothetical protein
MKVIRNGIGWDIAFDMVFTDKVTATIIAQRIAPLLSTLIRDAVDESMCGPVLAAQDTHEDAHESSRENALAAGLSEDQARHTPERPKQQRHVVVAPAVYATQSIASRVRAMGLELSSGAD